MVMNNALVLFAASLLALSQTLAALGMGSIILPASQDDHLLGADTALRAMFGFFLYSLIYLLLSLFGCFYWGVAALPVLAGLTLFITRLARPVQLFSNTVRRIRLFVINTTRDSLYVKLVLSLCVILLAFYSKILIQELTPDALVYYYAQAKLIAGLHHYASIHTFSFLGDHYPFFGEMLFAASYLFGGDLIGQFSSKLICFSALLFSLVLMYRAASAIGLSRLYSSITVLILLTSRAIIISQLSGKAELFSLLASLSAMYILLTLEKERNIRSVSLAGLCVAFSILAKCSLLLQAPIIAAILYLAKRFPLRRTHRMEIVAAIGAIAICLLLGWTLKNIVVANEPFAPFYYLHDKQHYGVIQELNNPEATRQILFTYPLALVFGDYLGQEGGISPIVCLGYLFVCVALCSKQAALWTREATALAIGVVLSILSWISFNPSIFGPRYMYAVVVALVLSIGPGFDFMITNSTYHISRISTAVFMAVVSVLLILYLNTFSFNYAIHYPHSYRSLNDTGFIEAANVINGDSRTDITVRLLSSFFEPFNIAVLSSFKTLQEDIDYSKVSKNDFWHLALTKKIDYIYAYHLYVYYPQYKSFLECDEYPEGLSVERIQYKNGTLYILKRS